MTLDNTPGDPTSGNNPPSDIPSIPALERYIFEPDEYTQEIVPRRLDPSEVAKFLLGRVDRKLNLKSFVQVERVAEFYDTFEVADKFKTFLDGKEANVDERRKSIVIARIIAGIGRPQDIEFLIPHFANLANRAEESAEFEDLILLYDRMGGETDALRKKTEKKVAELESKKESGESARVAYLDFRGKIFSKLDPVEKAQIEKRKILGIADRAKRIEEEIKAYLTVEYGYIEYLEPWAAKRLRKETWARHSNEQIIRNDEAPLEEDVAKSLSQFTGKVDQFRLTPEEKEFAKIRILRAIRFFGGKVSEQDDHFLDLNKTEQQDTLANEGFLISE